MKWVKSFTVKSIWHFHWLKFLDKKILFFLQVNPEHYVFSTFGVLHVYPDQPAESMSLSDWQREAVLWTAVSNIPFFKNFLVLKMFCKYVFLSYIWFMLFNATFNNISVISLWSVLLVEESGVLSENHRPVQSHWQTLSHNVVSSTPRHEWCSNSQL
jgi:hypothetical protein